MIVIRFPSCRVRLSHATRPHTDQSKRYIIDGNALFLTATESAWRLEASGHFAGGGIIIAIGYPCTGTVFHARRGFDLTPSSANASSREGGADQFLDFIVRTVRPAVKARFPYLSCSREALYGHSYGGLFALHTLFTRSDLFDFYIASSPSIWWGGKHILQEAKMFVARENLAGAALSSLLLFVGSFEQNPPQRLGEALEKFEARKQMAVDLNMGLNLHELFGVLNGCPLLGSTSLVPYEGEEHISVMACSISRGLTVFFEDWVGASGRSDAS